MKAPLLAPVALPDFVMPMSEYLKSEFFTDCLGPEGDADCATGMRIFDEGERHATLALQYAIRHREEMHERVSPLLRRLAPRLRGALLANRTTLRNQAPALNCELIHNLIDPALVVDQTCRVISANRLARDLLASSKTARVGVRDLLTFQSREIGAHFARLVREACQRAPGSAGYTEFRFEDDGATFRASILPISQNLHSSALGIMSLFARGPVALIILRRESRSMLIDDFQSRFRLTRAEMRMVQALCQGGSLAQLADQLGIAYETARNQLKAAFSKTGTHSQRELVHLAMQRTARS